MDCDFDNDEMRCQYCDWRAGGRDWRRNCKGRAGEIGVGWRLEIILNGMNAKKVGGCNCNEMISKMNRWGITGCREHRAEIVEHLKAAYKETSWADFAAASAKAITSGLAFKINPLDPFGSLVDEAIRLAEVSPPAT